MRSTMNRSPVRILGAAGVLLVAATIAFVGGASRAEGDDDKPLFVGPENTQGGCISCHEFEVKAWQKTKHYKSHDQLEADKAYTWAAELYPDDEPDPIDVPLCRKCHVSRTQKGNAGVSCESCHGAATSWVKRHYDFGEGIKTPKEEAPEHREARYAEIDKLGMIRPGRIYSFVSNCQGCHMIAEETLVNGSDHKATTEGFELVAWTHGEVRHNFLNEKNNPEQSKERKRTYFVAGKIAEVEFGLRGLAKATVTDGRFAKAVAQRVGEAKDSLTKVADGLSDAEAKALVQSVLDTLAKVELKANNAESLTAAADKVREAGIALATKYQDGVKLAGIDALVPGPDQYKGKAFVK